MLASQVDAIIMNRLRDRRRCCDYHGGRVGLYPVENGNQPKISAISPIQYLMIDCYTNYS